MVMVFSEFLEMWIRWYVLRLLKYMSIFWPHTDILFASEQNKFRNIGMNSDHNNMTIDSAEKAYHKIPVSFKVWKGNIISK